MNWVILDINDKKTFPLFELPEKMTIIFALDNNKFMLGSIIEQNGVFRVDCGDEILSQLWPLEKVKAWAYVMPVENKFKNIQEFMDHREIEWACKAMSFSEAKNLYVDIYEYIYLFSILRVYDFEEMFEDGELSSNFTSDCDQYLLIKKEDELYLVDNQGYGYARYIVKIELRK